MNPERARRRRIRRRILFGVAGLLILAATMMGGLSLLFPWVLAHPERVQQFLSDRLQRPVVAHHRARHRRRARYRRAVPNRSVARIG